VTLERRTVHTRWGRRSSITGEHAARMSMAREVVLTTYHHTETSFEYLKMHTPKVLAVHDWPELWLATQVNILPVRDS